MPKYKLIEKGWWDHDDPEVIIYFQIVDENIDKVWESSWHDTRDLIEGIGSLHSDFLEEVDEACIKYGLKSIKGYRYWQWCAIANDTGEEQEDV